jgi:hypothetical protein
MTAHETRRAARLRRPLRCEISIWPMSQLGQGRRSGTAQMCFRSISVSRPSGGGTEGLLSATTRLVHRSKQMAVSIIRPWHASRSPDSCE